jgi:hypothetical protein
MLSTTPISFAMMAPKDLADLAIVEDDVVAAFSRETYVLELHGVTRLSIAIHAERPLELHLVGEKEWLQWRTRGKNRRTSFDGLHLFEVSATTLATFEVAITASPKDGLTTVVLIVTNPGAVRSSFHIDVRSSQMETKNMKSAKRKGTRAEEDSVPRSKAAGVP